MPALLHSRKYHAYRLRLVQARKSRDMTQLQVAEKLGRSQSFVSKYEHGERRLDLLEFLEVAEALDINVSRFLKDLKQAIRSL